MKNVKGIWLPDQEFHLEGFADQEGWRYQKHKFDACLKYIKNWDTAIDVGGHCGLWSMQMVEHFRRVYAFEPVPAHRECFEMNAPEAELIPCALGEKSGTVKLKWDARSTGNTKVAQDGDVTADLKTLDSFGIRNVGFIKIDCEGYEMNVLKGGEETIRKWHPVIIVEQKPNKAQEYGFEETEAKDWLKKRGYKLQEVLAGDFILA